MKKYFLILMALAVTVSFTSCKKEKVDPPTDNKTIVTGDVNAGLGSKPGYPVGEGFGLPTGVTIVGDIRGGMYKGPEPLNKDTYTGPFDVDYRLPWVSLGTGTFVNLYITFFNSNSFPVNFIMPGGLIFIDSADQHEHVGVYQKGFILQDVSVTVPASDSAYIHLRAYCLNHTLLPSSYDAVYYIGVVTYNPNLNQIVGIMAGKQYPFGQEYNIQTIIWNVTDYGLNITQTEINYLNSLP